VHAKNPILRQLDARPGPLRDLGRVGRAALGAAAAGVNLARARAATTPSRGAARPIRGREEIPWTS